MDQVLLRSNTIDWKRLITINLQKHPELEFPPVAQEDLSWSRSRSLPLPSSPVLWLFLNVPRWTENSFGGRAWKWHRRALRVCLCRSSLRAPQTQSSEPEARPEPGQWARPRPLGSAHPGEPPHAAAARGAAWERETLPAPHTPPPALAHLSQVRPSLPHRKTELRTNRIAMHGKARRWNSMWRRYLTEPRSLRLLPDLSLLAHHVSANTKLWPQAMCWV